jgi:hypothetical protein
MHMQHIVELDNVGWSVNHPLWCSGNLLDCPVTQLCQNMPKPPKTGRYWGSAEVKGDRYILNLGEAVPMEIQGTSRRTSYHFTPKGVRPQ